MLTLKKIKKVFRGSSFPTEVELSDGQTYVLKMRGAGNGAPSLVAEFVVNRIAAAAGWEVPNALAVEIPENFPWEFGTDEFDDLVTRSFGVNLALVFIPGAVPLECAEVENLSGNFLSRLMAVDAFFNNYDRLAISQNVVRDETGKPWFIDHGSCRFFSADAATSPITLPKNHLLKSREADHGSADYIRELVSPEIIDRVTSEIPEPWLRELGTDAKTIGEILRRRLAHLPD